MLFQRWATVCDAGPHIYLNPISPKVEIIINDLVSSFCFILGGGPRVVASTAAFHARVRGSVPGLGGLKETKMFLPHPRVKGSSKGSLRDRGGPKPDSFHFCFNPYGIGIRP